MSWHRFSHALLLFVSLFASVDATPDVIRGVNLGGWLVTEPWLTPTLYNSTGALDEWHLTSALGKEAALQTLQAHWSSFYSRDDFVSMKNADSVRIPLGYWAVDLLDFEPYVSGQYPYLIQAVNWAQQVGMTVLIDLHGVPGSQNGWEESGLIGPILFTANSSNSDRSLNVLKNLTTEFTKPIYGGVVTNIELVNEPIFDGQLLKEFYTAGSNVVGAANSSGINITIHDAFYNPPTWKNYNPWNPDATSPAQFLTLDTHQFWGFPPLNDLTESQILEAVCNYSATVKQPNSGILPVLVGEWSLDTGVTANSTTDSATDQAKRTWFRTLFEAQNAAYTPHAPGQPPIGWYFWAWRTEYDIDAWSFSKGLAQEYIPSNVSDPSTYAFPLLANGCIDTSFKYTASATLSSTAATSTSASAGPSSTSAGKTSDAMSLRFNIPLAGTFALLALSNI